MKWKRPALVTLLAVALVFAGCTGSGSQKKTSSSTESKDSGSSGKFDRVITVEGTEYSYSPSSIELEKGQKVKVVFKNVGSIAHDIKFGKAGIKTEVIQAGKTDTITFTAPETGTYSFWCTVPGHRSAGMEGEMHVHGEGEDHTHAHSE
ncbi:MAG: cupredoxin domain-containing protein [Candidatus Nanohaloarchaea archaeon]|nr:cupredoxin domain-containing protein [Candidatus Nanohaloarchaea archaeon]